MLNLTALPTSEEELGAQINEAFPPEPAPEAAKVTPEPEPEIKTETPEPEYIPPEPDIDPNEDAAAMCGYGLHKGNRFMPLLGFRELTDDEIEKISSKVGACAAHRPNLFKERLNPKQKADLALLGIVGGVVAGLLIDKIENTPMRNVTPEPAPADTPTDGVEPVQEGEPLYGR